MECVYDLMVWQSQELKSEVEVLRRLVYVMKEDLNVKNEQVSGGVCEAMLQSCVIH